MDDVALGPGSEFDLIRRLTARWGARASGIGDDAAVLDVPLGKRLIASVDSAVEGRHFEADWLTPREIGYRAVAAALSDLAAMAAQPIGILVAIATPEAWLDRLEELADGIADALDIAAARIVGGNLSAAGELSITTTVLGVTDRPLTRVGARAGDRVYVTGVLGGPAAAIERLQRGESPEPYRDRFARPVPRLREAAWLAEHGAAAAIDVSDGLIADLRHLASASRVSIELDANRVPRFGGVGIAMVLSGGEEYELVVTAPELDVAEFVRRFDLPLTEVGSVGPDEGAAVRVIGASVVAPGGYDHFSA